MPGSETSAVTSNTSSQALSVPPSPELGFDEEMDRLWMDCEILARDASMPVKPLHISLLLIFGRIDHRGDPRLYNTNPELPKSLELPLFWTAISRAASIEGSDLATYLNLTRKKITVTQHRHLPQIIGQAMWDEVNKGRFEGNPAPEGSDIDIESRAHMTTKAIFSRANKISREHSGTFVAPQHVLLALLEECADIKAILEKYLKENVKKLSGIVQDLRPMTIRHHHKPPLFPELNKWADDLTEDAKKLLKERESTHPLICRNTELRRLINVLSRLKKNSAVLLGDPGVGKTAIAEELARRLIEGNLKVDGGKCSVGVPESVVARVFNLNLASILASTACKSAYEQIVKMIMDEVVQHEDRGIRAILFMDNLSQIAIGGYRGDGTGLDAATIMKPFLTKGKVRVVGCSTFEDFRIHIEKDGALARQFSQIQVCESTPEQTLEILRGMKPALQRYHRVRIQDKALVSATNIAIRYFAHKRLPDAAIDLIDETCASAALARNSDFEVVWKLQRKRVVLEMDIRSLRRDIYEGSDKRLTEAEKKLQVLDDRIENWRLSGKLTRNLERKLKETRKKIKEQGDLLITGDIKRVEDRNFAFATFEKLQLEEEDLQDKLEKAKSGTPNTEEVETERELEEISPQTVSKVASYYTFIPPVMRDKNTTFNGAPIATTVTPIDPSEILNLTERLNNMVIGQEEAVQAVTSAIQCLWVGLKSPRKPIASFLFAGPSGSGKTLLVKELGNIALRQAGTLLRIDANDYAKSHCMTRLIGTPSCTGYDNGGQLTECVKRKPFSIVYIKDIEKGCVEFRMAMQTILDEGTLRDGDGNVVDFSNCIVVISTSVGQMNLEASITEEKEAILHFEREVESAFPDEFLSRIDQRIVFRRMTSATLIKMIDTRLEELRKQLALIGLQFRVNDATRGYIQTQVACSRVGSARRTERIIRTEILTPLAKLLLENDMPENRAVVLSVERPDGVWKLSPKLSEREREVEPVVEQRAESPVPSSPATSYYSLDSTQSNEISLAGSTSVDHEEDSQSYSWSPSLQHARPPVLCPLPERQYLF